MISKYFLLLIKKINFKGIFYSSFGVKFGTGGRGGGEKGDDDDKKNNNNKNIGDF